jgi:hypothetical protein
LVVIAATPRTWSLDRVSGVQAQQQPLTATVCEIERRPQDFDGRMVRVRARVIEGFEVFAIRDGGCADIWLDYPGASGFGAMVSSGAKTPELNRPEIALKRDAAFDRFVASLEAEMYPRNRETICQGCFRYEVTATMTGRLDYGGKGRGFGHLNSYPTRLLLQSVADVSAKDLVDRYDPKEFSTTKIRFPKGVIGGRLIDVSEMPMPEQVVYAIDAVPDGRAVPPSFFGITDDKGQFTISVPPGSYVVGINVRSSPSPKLPYTRTFFPHVSTQAAAQKFEIRDHQQEALEFRLAGPLVRREVPVSVVWPDGRPVPDANVWLEDVDYGSYNVVGESVSHTDANGRFTLVGFENRPYVIHANIYVKPNFVRHCAPTVRLDAGASRPSPIPFTLSMTGDGCRR